MVVLSMVLDGQRRVALLQTTRSIGLLFIAVCFLTTGWLVVGIQIFGKIFRMTTDERRMLGREYDEMATGVATQVDDVTSGNIVIQLEEIQQSNR